jgi:hypothetical protein
MKKLLKKINNSIEEHSIGLQIGVFFIVLSELLHFLKYSKFSVDFMMVEVFVLIFIVLVLNVYHEEKDLTKKILKIAGLILLFMIITFQIMFDHILGENFTCCEEFLK